MATEGNPIFSRLYGSDWLQKLAEELLSNPTFAQAFATAVQKGLETKGRIDRNLETVLGLLNVPSRADMKRLATKLDAVQGSLLNLNVKLDRLLEGETHGRRARKAAGKEPAS